MPSAHIFDYIAPLDIYTPLGRVGRADGHADLVYIAPPDTYTQLRGPREPIDETPGFTLLPTANACSLLPAAFSTNLALMPRQCR